MLKIHKIHFHYDVIDKLLKRRKIPLPQKGERYGRLVVTGDLGYIKSGTNRLMISCRCDCGRETYYIYVQTITGGRAVSCGCAPKGFIKKVTKRAQDSPLYSTWGNMRARCLSPRSESYKWYGARGVSICEEWRTSFWAFHDWAMANGWSNDLSLDRIDYNGDYEPDNCRWATSAEQARNKRDNVIVTAFGESRIIMDWISDPRCVVDDHTLSWRIKNGWDHKDAITKPPDCAQLYEAFGEAKAIADWANDPRCVVAVSTLRERAKPSRKLTFEQALTMPAASKPVPEREKARAARRAKNALRRAAGLPKH